MKTRFAILASFGLLGALLLYTLAVYSRLPDLLPIHWNIRGEVDGWADKAKAVMLMPGVVILLLGLTIVLPAVSPRPFNIDSFRPTFNYLMVVTMCLMSYIHLIMLQAGLHPDMNMNRPLLAGVFLFIALTGNILGKTRRNRWMGIRTPWTLKSDQVWTATHRMAGRLMVVFGIGGGVCALAGVPAGICIGMLVAAVLYPAVYSYFLYRRLGV